MSTTIAFAAPFAVATANVRSQRPCAPRSIGYGTVTQLPSTRRPPANARASVSVTSAKSNSTSPGSFHALASTRRPGVSANMPYDVSTTANAAPIAAAARPTSSSVLCVVPTRIAQRSSSATNQKAKEAIRDTRA